ncbi:hypothetical protein BU16DRAFT_585992 [Lophium mytilinum]|uniref:BZIP domain-containing protein n=1 Tax=Lophium mytilinum TaxID=390894 RepID=A0A6A6QCS0_9PEZI|nr:hypothetical protein BU16DRAFT_585992 [Lophium mytilinum]
MEGGDSSGFRYENGHLVGPEDPDFTHQLDNITFCDDEQFDASSSFSNQPDDLGHHFQEQFEFGRETLVDNDIDGADGTSTVVPTYHAPMGGLVESTHSPENITSGITRDVDRLSVEVPDGLQLPTPDASQTPSSAAISPRATAPRTPFQKACYSELTRKGGRRAKSRPGELPGSKEAMKRARNLERNRDAAARSRKLRKDKNANLDEQGLELDTIQVHMTVQRDVLVEELVNTVMEVIREAHLKAKQAGSFAADALQTLRNGTPDGRLLPFAIWCSLNSFYSEVELRELYEMGPTPGFPADVQVQDLNELINAANMERQNSQTYLSRALRVLQNRLPEGRPYPLEVWMSLRGLVDETVLHELFKKRPAPTFWRSDQMPKPDPKKAKRAHDPNWKTVPAESLPETEQLPLPQNSPPQIPPRLQASGFLNQPQNLHQLRMPPDTIEDINPYASPSIQRPLFRNPFGYSPAPMSEPYQQRQDGFDPVSRWPSNVGEQQNSGLRQTLGLPHRAPPAPMSEPYQQRQDGFDPVSRWPSNVGEQQNSGLRQTLGLPHRAPPPPEEPRADSHHAPLRQTLGLPHRAPPPPEEPRADSHDAPLRMQWRPSFGQSGSSTWEADMAHRR